MKEDQIPKFWRSNSPAKSRSGSFSTDGRYLYSGKRIIGDTNGYGQKILYNYTKEAGSFISTLVSKHVNLATFYSDDIIKVTNVK